MEHVPSAIETTYNKERRHGTQSPCQPEITAVPLEAHLERQDGLCWFAWMSIEGVPCAATSLHWEESTTGDLHIVQVLYNKLCYQPTGKGKLKKV